MKPKKIIVATLIENYDMKPRLASRYADLIISRAVRFYLDGRLDGDVVAEDLYHGEDFDCVCSQEDADKNKHLDRCQYPAYVNLDHSEKREKEYQDEILKV